MTHRLMTLSDGRSDAVRPELIGHLSSQLHVMLGGDAVASQASTDTSARVSSVPSDNVPATVHSLSLSNMRLDDATGLLAEESSALDGLSLQVSNAPIEPPPRDPDSVPMGWEQGLNYEALGLKEDNARLYNILHTVLRHREDLDQPFAVPGDLTFDACKLDEYLSLIHI